MDPAAHAIWTAIAAEHRATGDVTRTQWAVYFAAVAAGDRQPSRFAPSPHQAGLREFDTDQHASGVGPGG